MSMEEHPRIRGENAVLRKASNGNVGTSPHTRGKPVSAVAPLVGDRNIPAYAGKTGFRKAAAEVNQEHPRIRGENGVLRLIHPPKGGTSPHTRGKRANLLRFDCEQRNIPAYAGKTLWVVTNTQSAEEHPRIRGENDRLWTGVQHACGTSPHTRGKLVWFVKLESCDRNIPAYAGKTSRAACTAFSAAEHPRIRGENPATCPQ